MTWSRTLKRTLVGRPFATHEEEHQLLPKRLALPLFASDPLSSVAYATEEIMLVLVVAGAAALSRMIPIAIAIAVLVVIVVSSYRQTVRAYPQGGGAYLVTRDNLGLLPALVAAAALLTDYVLTVAVSVAAGVAAVTSAFPAVVSWKVPLALVLIALLATANLRGVRETGRLFAIPTYVFFATVMVMLAVGAARCLDGTCPQAASAGLPVASGLGGVGIFLVLRAFASGSTALTGIEAIADGVPAFREPKSENAARTLAIMASMSITMFLGITVLARAYDVRVTEATLDETGSVLSQVGRTAFGEGALFLILQFATVGILVLAANTAFQDFPRLSAILARDRLMPRQLRNQGDRLVFSNGILLLSVLAGVLIVAFGASLTRLIQLYVVGVFTSFTLSQSAMVRRWLRERSRGWRRSAIMNGIGAVTTGTVLVVVASVKFSHGAWIVIAAIPCVVLVMWRIRSHYEWVAAQLSVLRPAPEPPRRVRSVVLTSRIDAVTTRGIQFARLLQPNEVSCVHVLEGRRDSFPLDWRTVFRDVPLTVIEPRRGGIVAPLRTYMRGLQGRDPDGVVNVIVPEWAPSRRWWHQTLVHYRAARIKAGLLRERGLVVTNLVLVPGPLRGPDRVVPPIAGRVAVIAVGGVTQAALAAVAYARTTAPGAVVGVHVAADADYARRVEEEWSRLVPDIELEILESPYRATVGRILEYVRATVASTPHGTIVDVLIPEFIVPSHLGSALHNQTGFALKAALLGEPDVAVTSVPRHLIPETEAYSVREFRPLPDERSR